MVSLKKQHNMENKIFLLYVGESSFHNERHFKNFVKYLFSQSTKHQPNNETKNNCFIQCDENGRKGFLMNDKNPKVELSNFNKKFNKNYKSYKKFINDLNYVFFSINFEGEILTNIFTEEDGDTFLNMPPDHIDYVVSKYFNGYRSNFDRYINSILEGKEVVFLEKVNNKQRKLIDSLIYKEISKNGESLFYVTHNDQDSPYHVHRIIKK